MWFGQKMRLHNWKSWWLKTSERNHGRGAVVLFICTISLAFPCYKKYNETVFYSKSRHERGMREDEV